MMLEQFQISTNNFLNWILQNKDSCQELPSYTVEMLRSQIYESYVEIKKNIERRNLRLQKQKLQKFLDKDYSEYEPILKIKFLVQKNNKFFNHFIVQGSFGDLNIKKGWSDFDSIAVINECSLEKDNFITFLKVLREIDLEMRKIDPYQHHGIQFIHEYELLSYPNLYYPLNLLEDAKCLLGTSQVEVSIIDSRSYEIARIKSIFNTMTSASRDGVLKHHAKNNEYLLENYQNNAMYQMKYFLSLVMLLPTLWMNCLGVYCTKKDSFKLIKNFFKEEDLELINKASDIRKNWKSLTEEEVNNNLIPDELINVLGKDYLSRGGALAEKFKNELDKRIQ